MSLDETNADPSLNALESALAGLCPQPSRINRDRLLFEAGRESDQRRTGRARRLWLFTTVVASVSAASFGILLFDSRTQLAQLHVALTERPIAAEVASTSAHERHIPEGRAAQTRPPHVSPQPVFGQTTSRSAATGVAACEPAIVAQVSAGGQGNYLALRNRALRMGIDVLPDVSSGLADHRPAGASDAPAAIRDVWQRNPDHSMRQPDEFELFRRGLPVLDGERS